MTESIKDTLYRITEGVLEQLAFILSFPEEELSAIDPSTAVSATVNFSGPFSGRLVVLISESDLPELAGNMLGTDEETTTAERHDALKELINVVCGNLLPEIAGKKAVFNVAAPEVLTHPHQFDDESSPAAVAKLSLEEGQCDLYLFIDEGSLPEREAG
jgi:CheY-specific phosphatase CheX